MRKFFRRLKSDNNLKLLCAILVFPLIIGIIYSLPCKQIIAIDSGNLLSFYGTALGISASYYMYIDTKRKEKQKEIIRKTPKLHIAVDKVNANVFKIGVYNLVETCIMDIYLYNENADEDLDDGKTFEVAFNLSIDEEKRIKPQYNITDYEDIIDRDGYPKFVQIGCCDEDGNRWGLTYDKWVRDNDIVYYLSMCERS